jgi:hypothetical protein
MGDDNLKVNTAIVPDEKGKYVTHFGRDYFIVNTMRVIKIEEKTYSVGSVKGTIQIKYEEIPESLKTPIICEMIAEYFKQTDFCRKKISDQEDRIHNISNNYHKLVRQTLKNGVKYPELYTPAITYKNIDYWNKYTTYLFANIPLDELKAFVENFGFIYEEKTRRLKKKHQKLFNKIVYDSTYDPENMNYFINECKILAPEQYHNVMLVAIKESNYEARLKYYKLEEDVSYSKYLIRSMRLIFFSKWGPYHKQERELYRLIEYDEELEQYKNSDNILANKKVPKEIIKIIVDKMKEDEWERIQTVDKYDRKMIQIKRYNNIY